MIKGSKKIICLHGHNKDIVGRAPNGRCKQCVKDYLKEYRKSHRDKTRAEAKKWSLKPGNRKKLTLATLKAQHVRRQFIQILKDKPCADCHIKYGYWVMQFDHRPGEIKLFNIGSSGVHKSRTLLLKEVAKCDLVCSNCHANRTHQRRIGEDNGN